MLRAKCICLHEGIVNGVHVERHEGKTLLFFRDLGVLRGREPRSLAVQTERLCQLTHEQFRIRH